MLIWEVLAASTWATLAAVNEYGLENEPPCVQQYIFASSFIRSALALALLLRKDL